MYNMKKMSRKSAFRTYASLSVKQQILFKDKKNQQTLLDLQIKINNIKAEFLRNLNKASSCKNSLKTIKECDTLEKHTLAEIIANRITLKIKTTGLSNNRIPFKLLN